MAYISTIKKIKIGDKIKLTKKLTTLCGYVEIGSIVRIINIGERGYDIEIDGYNIYECGLNIGEKI